MTRFEIGRFIFVSHEVRGRGSVLNCSLFTLSPKFSHFLKAVCRTKPSAVGSGPEYLVFPEEKEGGIGKREREHVHVGVSVTPIDTRASIKNRGSLKLGSH